MAMKITFYHKEGRSFWRKNAQKKRRPKPPLFHVCPACAGSEVCAILLIADKAQLRHVRALDDRQHLVSVLPLQEHDPHPAGRRDRI